MMNVGSESYHMVSSIMIVTSLLRLCPMSMPGLFPMMPVIAGS